MRFPATPAMLLLGLALLLSGCTSPDGPEGLDGADADAPEAGAAASDASAAPAGVLQEETASWLAPVSNGCIDPAKTPDVGPGITYGLVEVDPETHGREYEATFDFEDGFAIQLTFFDAAGEYLGGRASILALGMEPVLEGDVPEGATEVHLTSCGAPGGSATYRAGDL